MTGPVPAAREPEVRCEINAGVAVVSFHRPARNNAWTAEMEVEYFDLLERLDVDPAVRVVVVRGSGDRAFCPGADMAGLADTSQRQGTVNPLRTRPMSFPRTVRKPMIAAINGACAGIGLAQALYCDLRFAAASANMTTAFVRRGLAAEFAVPWLLTRLIGSGHAADLLLSGRRFTAAEAAEMGLVNRVFDAAELMPFVLRYAGEMAAQCSPMAMASVKEQLRRDWQRPFELAEGEAQLLSRDPDRRRELREGIESFIERRPPQFPPLGPRRTDF